MSEHIDWKAIMAALAEPMEYKTYDAGKAGSLAYIDARDAMDRFDAVIGPEWSTAYRCIDPAVGAVECTITIHGISKADVGYPNDPRDIDKPVSEPWKAAYSDAFKRAAVHWGVGRFLYRLGRSSTPQQRPPAPHGGMVAQDGDFGSPPPNTHTGGDWKPATEQQAKMIYAISMDLKMDRSKIPARGVVEKEWSFEKASKWIDSLKAEQERRKADSGVTV